MVPGPDFIGKFETSFADVRDSFVRRDGVLEKIKGRRSGGDSAQSDSTDSTGTSSSNETTKMT